MIGSVVRPAADQILANDHERHARRPEVLLRAGVDQPEPADVDRPAEHVGRGVGDERRRSDVGQRLPLGALDRVVGGDVHVGRAGRQLQLLLRGDARVVVGLRRPGDVDRADLLRFLDRLVGPRAGVDVVGGRARAEQVHRHHRELQRGAPLQHEDLVVRRHARQRADVLDRAVEHVLERLRAVADLHDRHADVGQRDQIALRLLEHRKRQDGGAGGEVVDTGRGWWHRSDLYIFTT